MKSSIHLSLDVEILKKFNNISEKINKNRSQIMTELLIDWIEKQQRTLYKEEKKNIVKKSKIN